MGVRTLIKKALAIQEFSPQRIYSDYWDPSMSTAPPTDITSLIDQYGTSGWVYIGAKRIALKASSADLILTDAAGNEVETHILYDLLKKPNQGMSGRMLRHLLHLHLELVGEAFWYAVPLGVGGIEQFIPLPPNLMEVIPGKDKWVEGYIFDSPTGEKVPFEPEEIIHFMYPNPDPANPLRGTTGLRTLTYQVATNQNAQIWNYQFFVNGARPSGYLATELDLPEDEAERLRKLWDKHHRGQKNWNKTAVASHGLKYLNVGLNQSEMDFLNQLKNSRDFILNVMGVPKSIAGIIEDVNRANSFQDEVNFMTYTVNPILELIADTINAQIMPLFGDTGLVADFETLMPKDDEFTLKKCETLVRRYIMTINEARNEYGLKSVSWGNRPFGPVRDGVLSLEEPVQQPTQGPGQPAKPPEETPPQESPPFPAEPVANPGEQSFAHPLTKISVEADWLAYSSRIDTRARRMMPVLRQAWGDVERSVLQQMMKSMNGDGAYEVEHFNVDSDGTLLVKAAIGEIKSAKINWSQVKEKIRFILLHHSKEAANAEAEYVKRQYRLDGKIVEAVLATWAASRAVKFSRLAVQRAEEELTTLISASASAGLTVDQLIDELKIYFDGKKTYETKRFAESEMAAASSMGRVEAFKSSTSVAGLQWVTAGDERVRSSHQEAESQVVPVGGLFHLGSGVVTPGPGMSGNPEEDVNCRCMVVPVLTSPGGE